MKTDYKDITSRIAEEPKWYDQNGVPRYDDFHPRYCPNIYSRDAVLLLIACQRCGVRFHVELHSGMFEGFWGPPKELHYGDPPAHGCVGDTMNCEDIRVLEVWHKDRTTFEWGRQPDLEGEIE